MLDLRDVSLSFGGTPILTRADLRIEQGRIIGLVGASGTGKTLLSLAILGLLPQAIECRGQISWNGITLSDADEDVLQKIRGREIGIVFQNTSAALDPLITIGDQLADLLARHQGLSSPTAKNAARDVFRQVEWPDAIDPFDRYPHEVSGGQRQRALIAMAIALKPKLVIADEPTASLDVTTAKAMLNLLKRLARENGSGLLIISHDLPALATFVDDIAFLNDTVIAHTSSVSSLHDGTAPLELLRLYERSLPNRKIASAAPRDTDLAIAVSDLTVRHRTQRVSLFAPSDGLDAVKHLTAQVGKGECLALVGESGSGKSTFARTLIGLHHPQSGTLDVLGLDPRIPKTLRTLWQKVRLVFQDPMAAVDPNWTVRQIVDEPLALVDGRLNEADRSALVAVTLQKVGIAPQLFDRFPHQLSGGQLQRVTLARALVTRPDILILDEPISALDADARGQILTLLVELAAETGLSILLITHDLGVARAIADRVVVMKDGEIVEEGEIMAVLDHPKHAYTQALIAASSMLNAARLLTPDLAGRAPQG